MSDSTIVTQLEDTAKETTEEDIGDMEDTEESTTTSHNQSPTTFVMPDLSTIHQELNDILNPSVIDEHGNTRTIADVAKVVVKFTKGDVRLTSIDYRETGGKTVVTVLINKGKIRSENKYREVMVRLRKAMDL